MILNHVALSENGLRRSIRVGLGATLGFTICKLMNWDYGVFFTIFPILLLGLVPEMNAHAAKQLLASSAISGIELGILGGLFGTHPGIMTPVVFVLFLYRFIAMSRGSLFLFGANGVLTLSIMLHFASYADTDINDMIFTNFEAGILSVLIAYAVTALIPDLEPPPKRTPPEKQPHRVRHEALMGASVATLSFVVFQVFDLYDSLSAQVTTILLLFPMHWHGSMDYARKRAMGATLGVIYALLIQVILQDWTSELILVILALWIGTFLFCQTHVKEGVSSGAGFSAMTTLAVLFGLYITPQNDLVFTSFYRVSSIMVAIVGTLVFCYLMHYLLNSFQATRFGD